MLGCRFVTTPMMDRRAERHAATKREIRDAAWRLARERGLGGWSMRDLAAAVGMRAPSLYGYFAGKNDVYDAMYAEGCTAFLERIDATAAEAAARDAAPEQVLRAAAHLFVSFAVEDPARHALLFLRTLPGFEPSADSFALAQQALDGLAAVLAAAGVSVPEQVDLWTALVSGLATQQVSNDPGGSRWRRLVDRAVSMFLATQVPAAARGPATSPLP